MSVTSSSPLIAIAAMARNRVIGANGTLPWHLPGDLKFFKATTMGHVLIMGRKTFESIGRPLPGRETVVISRTISPPPGVTVCESVEKLFEIDFGMRKRFIVGGGEIYAQTVSYWDEVYLTLLDREVPGDTFLPEFEHLFASPEELQATPDYRILHYSRRNDREQSVACVR
jgi:dihydrofolate reductase